MKYYIGYGFMSLLTILFIALKFMGYITWSWWWVLSPLWLGFALFFMVCIYAIIEVLLILVAIAVATLDSFMDRS